MSDEHGPSLEELTRARIPYVAGLGLVVLVIGVLAYVPGMTTYQEGLILFAELGVGVMLVAGIAWMLASRLRKPSDH